VEISLDKGRSWRLAKVEYLEDRYREAAPQSLCGGLLDMSWRESSFCWCFWDLEIAISELQDAQDIFVRAMDESMNLQPRDMYWSVLGMMNNPWFRVVINKEDGELRFEHPTQPALIPGGWMDRVKKAGGDLTNGYWGERLQGDNASIPVEPQVAEIKMTKDGVDRPISFEEFKQHETGDQPWFAVNNEVYDGTPFLTAHPGGAQSILSAAGVDSTEEFMAIRMVPPFPFPCLAPN
jgi:nitrate reductase (NAD(P)H)